VRTSCTAVAENGRYEEEPATGGKGNVRRRRRLLYPGVEEIIHECVRGAKAMRLSRDALELRGVLGLGGGTGPLQPGFGRAGGRRREAARRFGHKLGAKGPRE